MAMSLKDRTCPGWTREESTKGQAKVEFQVGFSIDERVDGHEIEGYQDLWKVKS